MNKKLFAAPLIAALALCVAPRVGAQAIAPQIVAVGSSGSFSSVSIAMAQPDPIVNPGGSPYCGSEIWSAKGTAGNGLVYGNDGRNNGTLGSPVPKEFGNVEIVWDNDTTPTKVCVYLSVDSVVGQRLYLGVGSGGNGTIQLGAAQTTAGANAVAYLHDICAGGPNCAGLPVNIFNSVNGAHFNMAFSDIRPEDAQYAYDRAACSPADQITCFGYGRARRNRCTNPEQHVADLCSGRCFLHQRN